MYMQPKNKDTTGPNVVVVVVVVNSFTACTYYVIQIFTVRNSSPH
jgi:hypothetical protein